MNEFKSEYDKQTWGLKTHGDGRGFQVLTHATCQILLQFQMEQSNFSPLIVEPCQIGVTYLRPCIGQSGAWLSGI